MLVSPDKVEFATGELKITAQVYFMDRMKNDFTNQMDVLSRMLTLCSDFYTEFNDNELKHGFYFSNAATATPATFFEDLTTGYVLPIIIQVGEERNEDNIPY